MPDKPSIYGPEYDALNTLSLKFNEWESEVRRMEGKASGKRADVDEAFRIVIGHLGDSMIDVAYTMNQIKEEYEDAERERGPRLHAYQDMTEEQPSPLAAE